MPFTLLMQNMFNRRRHGLRESRNGQSKIDLTHQHRDTPAESDLPTINDSIHEQGHRPLKYNGRGSNGTPSAVYLGR
jgi:hypothetical protein